MKRYLSLFLAALAAQSLHGALAELNVADGSIESPDGLFVGRDFTIAKNFKLELLDVPKIATEGQWVPTGWDTKGRLIVASYNSEHLMRLTIPALGSTAPVQAERIMTNVGSAEGTLVAFNSLYINVNRSNVRRHGIYRLTDTNGDDKYDQLRVIRNLQGTGDHGTHSLKLSPDGKSIFVVSGNATPLTDVQSTRVPQIWAEDNLVPRMSFVGPGPGFTPEAWVASFDPEGKNFELFSMGHRNPVDEAFNKDGELFLYDSDMEWDMGTPWYRPTNVQHVISGGDAGFRDGSRKHPLYYIDNYGVLAPVGSGSPTGVTFGTNGKFPARYQDGMFISDWSYGNLWSVDINPAGSGYTAEVAPFISGRPFAVSGVIVNPADGSLLVTTTGTELYRVTYVGAESTAPTKPDTRFASQRDLRHNLEKYHGHKTAGAVEAVWPYLGDPDRALRFAARIALEWQDQAGWRDRALAETDPRKSISLIVALARLNGLDDYNRPPDYPKPDKALQARMLAALDRIDWGTLSYQDKLDLLRAYSLTFIRMGAPAEATRQQLIAKFDPQLPSTQREMNWELAEMLVYLDAPSAVTKLMGLLRSAPTMPYYGIKEWINPQLRQRADRGTITGPNVGASNAFLAKQEDQIMYAQFLRVIKTGWTPALREEYFKWFNTAGTAYRGGNQFVTALQTIRADAISQLPNDAKTALGTLVSDPMTVGAAGGGGL
ncbi:MAG: hypothetical protein RL324_1509 [Verrucomicrobiota bacterium]|jgi:hypothetical protein